MVAVLFDDGSTPAWIYIGEVEPARLAGTPPDDRPFVIWDTPSTVRAGSSDNYFNRISPLDDVTGLVIGNNAIPSNLYATGEGGGFLGLWDVFPWMVHFRDVSHKHTAGYLRNVGFCSADKGASGTIAGKTWMYRLNAAAYGGVCFAWDGSTDYP
jgi:hypothetical protein